MVTGNAPLSGAQLRHVVDKWDVGNEGSMTRLAVIGARGAVSFTRLDGPNDADDATRALNLKWEHDYGHPLYPMGVDIGYHSTHPPVDYDVPRNDDCSLAQPCFYDGSSLPAMSLQRHVYVNGLDDAYVLDYLTKLYAEHYGD